MTLDSTLGEAGLFFLSLSVSALLSLSSRSGLMAPTRSLGQGGNGVTIAQKGTLSLGLGLREAIGNLENVNHGRLISLARDHEVQDRRSRSGETRCEGSSVFFSLDLTLSLTLVRSTFPTSRGLGLYSVV